MAGVRKKPLKNGKYQAWYNDSKGKRKFFTGTTNRTETKRMAERLEDEHRQVSLGYRPPPKKFHEERKRPFSEVVDEYRAWGESKGGRNGMPWGEVHARMRKAHLEWWKERLGLRILADLDGILPRVESAMRKLHAEGRSGKTLQNYSESLCAFCNWAVDRGYLLEDPLKNLSGYNTRPRSYRRAMTPEEIQRLLEAAPEDRCLLYEVALSTGLRAKEIRSLKVKDLNPDACGLNLHARWTKNRKQSIQPIPRWLFEKLEKESFGKPPSSPLLYVPSHTARELDKDLEAADIPKSTPEGKVDFHSFRSIFITRVIEAGANVKEAQALARHSTPELTMNTYAKTSHQRLSQLTEKLSRDISEQKRCAKYVHHDDARAPVHTKNPLKSLVLQDENRQMACGFDSRRLHLIDLIQVFRERKAAGMIPQP